MKNFLFSRKNLSTPMLTILFLFPTPLYALPQKGNIFLESNIPHELEKSQAGFLKYFQLNESERYGASLLQGLEAKNFAEREIQNSEDSSDSDDDVRVRVSEVTVQSLGGSLTSELEDEVYRAITTRPGQETTRSQLQNDINNIFETGFFANVQAVPEDTPLGVRIIFQVQPNPILREVVISNSTLLEERTEDVARVVDGIFQDQYNEILNLIEFQDGVLALNQWYQENGYVLAEVTSAPRVTTDGTVTLVVAEGVIDSIDIRFLDFSGEPTNSDGSLIEGETREFVITREIYLRVGDVFNQEVLQQDLERIFDLGIFDDIRLSLERADNRKVQIIVNVIERNPKTFSSGVGFNFSGENFFTIKYSNDNLFGLAQELSIESQIGSENSIFELFLSSPGRTDIYLDRSNQFLEIARRALNAKEDNQIELSVESYNHLVDLYNDSSLYFHEALTHNNLSSIYYSSGEYALATESLRFAANRFRMLNEPALEILTYMKFAKSYRALGKPEKALESYYEIIKIIKSFKSQETTDLPFGANGMGFLNTDWGVTSELKFDNKFIVLANDLIESTSLLNITSGFSAVGDYQQAIYLANSPQIAMSFSNLASSTQNLIENSSSTFLEETIDFPREEMTLIFMELGIAFEKDISSVLRSFPMMSESLGLSFIFSDLSEEAIAREYEKVALNSIESLTNNFSQEILTTLPYIAYYISDSEADDLLELMQRTSGIISSFSSSGEYIGSDDEYESWISSLLEYINSTDSSDDPQEAARLNLWIRNNLLNVIELLFLGSPASSDDRDRRNEDYKIISISSEILENWPEESIILNDLEWLKGSFYKIRADAYYRLQDLENSISSYEDALYYLDNFPSSEEKILDQLKSIVQFFDFPDGLERSIQPFFIIFEIQKFDSAVKLAALHARNNNFTQSKQLYSEALLRYEELNRKYPEIIKISEKAEIHYGISYASLMLGDYDDASTNIEESIRINRIAFPVNSLISQSDLADIDLSYGYGLPNKGSINAKFSISPENSWSSLNDSSLRPCSNSRTYFACRQKYFDLYINLLLVQHKSRPNAGFDILALKASEAARSTSIGELREIAALQASGRRDGLQIISPEESVPFDEIQSLYLEKDTLILEYFLGEDKSYLWLLSSNASVQVFELPPRDIIEAKAEEFYTLLTNPSGRVRPQTTNDVGHELGDMLFGQIKDQLVSQRLIIVADGFLQYLPFSTIPNPAPDVIPSDAALEGEYAPVYNPLLLEHEVIHQPSLSSLIAIRQNSVTKPSYSKELAFFANPVFNHRDARVEQVKIAEGFEPFSPEELKDVEVLYSQLPETEKELEGIIESNLVSNDEIQTFFGYNADLDAALSPDLGHFRIVHFASHGIFNSNSPERSGIVLSSLDKNGVVQPGLLSPSYAFGEMDLSTTELVVLSGCRTGLSEGQVGREGITGLISGLFDAGAESVVASHWSVRDDATRELMQRFYQNMLNRENPMGPAEALREAKISMWNEPRWQTPYNWAAFTLQGEWQ